MDIPKIKKQRRYDSNAPNVFTFPSDTKGMGFDGKDTIADNNETSIYRPKMACVFPRNKPGWAVVAAEQAKLPRLKKELYVLHEFTSKDSGIFYDMMVEAVNVMHITDVCSRTTMQESQFINFKAEDLRADGKKPIYPRIPAMSKDDGVIGYHLNVLKDLSRADKQRLFYRKQSQLPQRMAEVPEETHDIVEDDFPYIAAVAYVINELITFETVEPEEGSDPNKNKYKTIGDILDYDGGYDPFKGM